MAAVWLPTCVVVTRALYRVLIVTVVSRSVWAIAMNGIAVMARVPLPLCVNAVMVGYMTRKEDNVCRMMWPRRESTKGK